MCIRDSFYGFMGGDTHQYYPDLVYDNHTIETPPTPERVRLGRWLFYDSRLSADGTVSCATCHEPEHAFSQGTAVATGIRGQKGKRKAPTFINQAVVLFPHFFWDGRAATLEEQAGKPIENPDEMDLALADAAARVGAEAVTSNVKAFCVRTTFSTTALPSTARA